MEYQHESTSGGMPDTGDAALAAEIEAALVGDEGAPPPETPQQGQHGQEMPPQEETPPPDAPPDGQSAPPQEEMPPAPPPVYLNHDGQRIALPGEAVQALTGALGGADPVELLRKGMAYDGKAARELQMLDAFAAQSGMTREQYIDRLEQMRVEQLVQSEVERVRAEFPDTPDTALRAIAEGRIAAQQAADQQKAAQRRQQLDETQQRIRQTVEQARAQAAEQAWNEYEALTGHHTAEDVPPRVLELVQQGLSPVAAHYRAAAEQAERALAVSRKNEQNRQQSPGSMAGAGEQGGFEADFLKAWD